MFQGTNGRGSWTEPGPAGVLSRDFGWLISRISTARPHCSRFDVLGVGSQLSVVCGYGIRPLPPVWQISKTSRSAGGSNPLIQASQSRSRTQSERGSNKKQKGGKAASLRGNEPHPEATAMILDHLADIEDIQISRRLDSIDPSSSIPDPERVRQQQEAKGRESSFLQQRRTREAAAGRRPQSHAFPLLLARTLSFALSRARRSTLACHSCSHLSLSHLRAS